MNSPYDVDKACRSLARRDPVLGRVIRTVGSCGVLQRGRVSIFAALMRSIVFQQLSGRAAGTIWGRVVEACPCRRTPTPEAVLSVDYEALRAAGLSNNKALAVQDLARKTLDGTVPSRRRLNGMADEAILEALTEVRGVGRWTVEMLLMFHLGRPDVFPAGDLGVRKGIAVTYGLEDVPDEKTVGDYSEGWRPWRSVGSWYMWRVLEIELP